MKRIKIICENCGAELEIKDKVAFCPYCGTKIAFDDGDRNINANLNYNHTYVERDEARIRENEIKENMQLQKLQYRERREKRGMKVAFLCVGGFFALMVVILLIVSISGWIAEAQGKICAGKHEDYIGENYKAVVRQFEEFGFTNIVSIDLEDSDLEPEKDGKVKGIFIDGDNNFGISDYFYPDDKVIIKYY